MRATRFMRMVVALFVVLFLASFGATTARAEDATGAYDGWEVQIAPDASAATIAGPGTHSEAGLIIPSTVADGVGSYRVVGIGAGAFENCTNVKSVSIPVSVTTIGERAFTGTSIESVRYAGTKAQWNAIEGAGKPDISIVEFGAFTVTFDTRGGTPIDEQVVEAGGKATEPARPTRTDWQFSQWFSDENLTQMFFFGMPINADTTLYASWSTAMGLGVYNESNPDPWSIDCGTVDIVSSSEYGMWHESGTMNFNVQEGPVTFTANPATGYVFKGWYGGTFGDSHYVEQPTDELLSTEVTFTTEATSFKGICAVFACSGHQWEQHVDKATPAADGRIYQVCSICGTEEAVAPLPQVSNIKLAGTSFVYTGKAIQPKVTVANAAEELSQDCYTLTYANNVNVGKATVKVTLKGDYYEGTKTLSFAIAKASNPMTAKGKTVKAKVDKKTTIKAAKACTIKGAQGKVTYKKAKGDKKITVSKAGKITVKKGLKEGKTYKVKIKVSAAGGTNYKPVTKTVTVKVKVG